MCGIAGVFAYGSGAPKVILAEETTVRDSMYSRGPDGCGAWVSADGRLALVHRRLAIIDLSDGALQPMATADGKLRIVFNGEIYNYRELKAELESQGAKFGTASDTEVLLELYRRKGPEMVRALRGMFAFAIFDEVRRELFLARDPFGIKPLYLSNSSGVLRFASQVKALLRSSTIDKRPEPAGHVGFFLWGSVPEPYTLYKGIRALPAGSTMIVTDLEGAARPRGYFSVQDELSSAMHPSALPKRVPRDLLSTALSDTVRHHLVADVPVGIFLSAGRDSSTLLALAAETGAPPLRTVTLAFSEFKGTANDESHLARAVADRYSAIHTTRWITRSEFESDTPRIFDAMDQPSIDGVNTYFVSKAAADLGLKVCLSGLGGDELFGGYPSFWQVPLIARMIRPFSGWPAFGRGVRLASSGVLQRFASPKYASLFEYGSSYGGAYMLRRGLFLPWELTTFLDAEFVTQGLRELQPIDRLDAIANSIADDDHKVAALEISTYMRNQLLRDADWASMAHSLEVRLPFVDPVLLREVVRLRQLGFRLGKNEMAHTPRLALPSEVLSRSKTGFSIPVAEWAGIIGEGVAARGLRGWARHVYDQTVAARQ